MSASNPEASKSHTEIAGLKDGGTTPFKHRPVTFLSSTLFSGSDGVSVQACTFKTTNVRSNAGIFGQLVTAAAGVGWGTLDIGVNESETVLDRLKLFIRLVILEYAEHYHLAPESYLFGSNISDLVADVVDMEIPVRHSPISGVDLKTLAAAATVERLVFLACMTHGMPITLAVFYAAGSVIILGAAEGVANAVKQGLFERLTNLLAAPTDRGTR